MMSEFARVLVGGLAAYAVLVGSVYAFQRSMMYHPDSTPPDTRRAGVPEMETVPLETADGLTLTAWYHPAGKVDAGTLVYFHGNAGTIEGRGGKIRPYLDAGYGVLLVSYRGYGGNPGSPTEEGLYSDARAALDFLSANGVPRNRIVLYGESLGTGVAVQMAWESARDSTPVAALVLEAPFSSMGDAAQNHYPYLPARWLVRDRYDSASKITTVRTPLLIVHGDGDRVVPISLGKRLFSQANEPKSSVWIPGGNHSGLEDFGLSRHVLAFLQRTL